MAVFRLSCIREGMDVASTLKNENRTFDKRLGTNTRNKGKENSEHSVSAQFALHFLVFSFRNGH